MIKGQPCLSLGHRELHRLCLHSVTNDPNSKYERLSLKVRNMRKVIPQGPSKDDATLGPMVA